MRRDDIPVILDTDLTTVIDMTKAINISPHKLDKSIWHLQDSDRILKRGPHVKMAEAEALRFVASSTQVPVPKLLGAYEKDGYGHIFMSRMDGKPLGNVLHILSEQETDAVVEQLKQFVESWRNLKGHFFGSLGFGPCRDVFFQHLPAINNPDRVYGPFKSQGEYFDGLADALRNSRPGGQLDEKDKQLISRIRELGNGPAVFSHGDLTPENILVDDQRKVIAVVDMGVAGFSISEREYFEARSRARNPTWTAMVDRIIPRIPYDTYSLFLELERELVRYSGI